MATQQTGTPPKTRRLGIFPDSNRNFVIVIMIVLFVIFGIIGVIGILRGWNTVFNVLFMIFAVISAILAILTFWQSNNPNEAPVSASHKSRRQYRFKSNISLTIGQEDTTQSTSESLVNNVANNQHAEQSAAINAVAANHHHQPSTNTSGVTIPASSTPVLSASTHRDELPQVETDASTKAFQIAEVDGADNLESLVESIVRQARDDVEKAQSDVQQAGALFIEGISASPKQIREARSLLSKARQSTGHLHSILNSNASLPEPLQSNQFGIIAQINIIYDQIGNYDQIGKLLSDLNKGIQGDYRSLNDALSKLLGLISD